MDDPEKILIIRFSSLGDVILASPLIRVLRNAYPTAIIDFVVKSEYADAVRFNPHLSSVIEFKTSEFEELKALRKTLYKTGYDTIIDIHNSLRSRFLRFVSGARNVYTIRKQVLARFALVQFKWNIYRRALSASERYFQTGRALQLHDDGNGVEVFVPDAVRESTGMILSGCHLEHYSTVVGLAPSSRHFTKRWPPDRFVELGIALARKHRAKVLVFGGKEDGDYCGDIAQMINADLGSRVAESFAGNFSLLETAAALDFCNIVVSNDTGLMHLAAARKRKLVAIFGSTVKEFGFFPCGTEHIVVEEQGLACRPCSHIGLGRCPKGHFKCMKDITVDRVLKAAESLMRAS
jgi:lipopolysaccharide heptosyltransferase II